MTRPVPPDGPRSVLEAVRGVLFIVVMYGLLLVMGLVLAIPAWLSRRWALFIIRNWCRMILWLLWVIAGTRLRVVGPVPQGGCIVASKHQSFLDILMLTATLPRPCFVMKKSIRWVPVLNIYAERLGNIPIDRNAKGQAMRSILDGAERSRDLDRQVIIFPQGTRAHPTATLPYRFGVVRLSEQLQQPIALAALNSGWFWPRTGIRRSPGVVTLQFLGEIPHGRPRETVLDEIATRIETASDALAEDAARQVSDSAAAG